MAFFWLVCVCGLGWASAADPKVREFYMYRASKDVTTSPYVQENVDLADLVGALKYIHTEVIAEHTLTDSRQKRKYDIDNVARWRVLVNNPGTIVDMNQPPMVFADFGPFVTFDYGQATNNIEELEQHGDFVGAQEQTNVASWEYNEPYYWFSLSGFCPNLPYVCTNGWTDPDGKDSCDHDPPIHTAMCTPDAPCPSKRTMSNPRERCDKMTASGKVLMGGLCKSDGKESHVTLQDPTGVPSCTYSYDPQEVKQVLLDDVVGIKDQDCTDGKCEDWLAFRTKCTDSKYKQMYDTQGATPRIVDSVYCIEYDIHPACAQSCSSSECLDVPEDKRELGLPFWKGRCDPLANHKRAESLAKAFGISGANDKHNVLESPTTEYVDKTCNRQGQVQCKTNFRSGGQFCTRDWGGVCTPCFIPGTLQPFPNEALPKCPLSVVKLPDYQAEANKDCPNGSCCKSRDASGKCCLYFDSCETKIADVEAKIETLNIEKEDSMILVEATENTAVVLKFIKRIAAEWGQVSAEHISTKEEELKELAYWSWGRGGPRDNGLESVKNALSDMGLGRTTTTTTTTMTAVAPAGGGDDGGSMSWIFVCLVVVALLGAAYMFKDRLCGDGGGGARQPLTGGTANEAHIRRSQEMPNVA